MNKLTPKQKRLAAMRTNQLYVQKNVIEHQIKKFSAQSPRPEIILAHLTKQLDKINYELTREPQS